VKSFEQKENNKSDGLIILVIISIAICVFVADYMQNKMFLISDTFGRMVAL